jgi:hypothetical protein
VTLSNSVLRRYIYDLQLPPSDSSDYVKLSPLDDEVESFKVSFDILGRK